MEKICFVAASPLSLRIFMRDHMLRLSEKYEVTAIANFSNEDLLGDWLPGVRLVSIPLARKISLLSDFIALIELWLFFRREHFDVVHSLTPKAGLLTMIAAKWSGVPKRIHTFTGQVWVTRKGIARTLLKNADCLISLIATNILTDSFSQRDYLEKQLIVRPGCVEVLGNGSIKGVDLDVFCYDVKIRKSIRMDLGIPLNDCVILFVGRLSLDKGVLDLAKAFSTLMAYHNSAWLVMVGPDEEGIIVDFERQCGDSLNRVRRIEFTKHPENFMAASDILVLPSYREGFNNVIIEAAACCIPAVASRIYGIADAIEENITGLMHEPGDVVALRDCLRLFCENESLRIKMGLAAHNRVKENFSKDLVANAFNDFYSKLLEVNH